MLCLHAGVGLCFMAVVMGARTHTFSQQMTLYHMVVERGGGSRKGKMTVS